ncbi:MAG TPA: hypothetical protein VF230_15245 [Acidimicrobiales bacterium]
MGYDLHLTRAEEWFDSELVPIPEPEWNAIARSALQVSTHYAAGEASPVYQFEDSADSPTMQWGHGQVTVWGAGETDIAALVALAERLDARLMGDDSETYPLE